MTYAKEKKVKAAATFTALSALTLGLGEARAQEPFRPVPVAPPCNASVTRGAQQALDEFMAELREKQRSERFDLSRRLYQERSLGNSTAGLETQERLLKETQRYEAKKQLIGKEAELKLFALKTYKCEPVLFYFVP